MAGEQAKREKLRKGELAPGQRLGRYRIDEVVGRGGMGTVYRAFDEETNREVAIKLLLPGLGDSLTERFLAECEAEAKIRHPHVMPVYDRGRFDGDRRYFVMELLYEPITLQELIEVDQKGALGTTWPRLRHWSSKQRLVQDVLIPIADGVDAANVEYGYLHRDLKPDNVLIDVRTRRPYLIDFGICHLKGQEAERGKIIGTPRFLSPEQARATLTTKTDVWGLGGLLHFILSGRPPIRESSPLRRQERDAKVHELLKAEAKARSAGDEGKAKELAGRRASLEAPGFRTLDDMLDDARLGRYAPLPENTPAAARAITEKAMAVDPEERYSRAGELANDLRAWVQGESVRALSERDATGAALLSAQRTVRRYVGPALLGVLGLLFGLVLGAVFLSGKRESQVERIDEAKAAVERVEAEVDRLAGATRTPTEDGLQHLSLRNRLNAAASVVATLPSGPDRSSFETALEALDARVQVPKVRADRTWKVVRVWDGEELQLEKGENDVPPGLYCLRATTHTCVPFRIPWTVAPAAPSEPPAPVTIDLVPPTAVPPGMVFVPAGGADAPAFLVQVSEVTYLEYAGWLDEVLDDERPGRLPKLGFQPDVTLPGRYLVKAGWENRAVTGVRAEDAAAYVAWRAEVFQKPYRLPTAEELRRAAGGDLLASEYASLFRPAGRVRGSDRLVPDCSPYGAENLLGTPAELVQDGDAFCAFGRGTAHGIERTDEALRHSEAVTSGRRLDLGFRMVLPSDTP